MLHLEIGAKKEGVFQNTPSNLLTIKTKKSI